MATLFLSIIQNDRSVLPFVANNYESGIRLAQDIATTEKVGNDLYDDKGRLVATLAPDKSASRVSAWCVGK